MTLDLIWIVLLFFNGAFSSESFGKLKEDSNIYNVDGKNNWSETSKFSNQYKSYPPKRRKRQAVQARMNGIQHIYESPKKGYDNPNSINSINNKLNSIALTPLSNPVINLEQGARQSFGGNMIENFNETPRQASSVSDSLDYKNTNNFQSASNLPNSLSKDVPLQSQMEDTNPQMTAQDIEQLHSDSRLGSLYNKDEMFNIPRTQEGNSMSYSPNNFPNLLKKDRSLISPLHTEGAVIPSTLEGHLNPAFDHHHFFTAPSHMEEEHLAGPLDHFHDDASHIADLTPHSLIHTSHFGHLPLDPPLSHIEPVIHPDSGPQVINPLGPDNLHIIKKFYPLPVVQKVPKPIPVVETRPVPYPVHQKLFHYVPRPYPQPFSKPDLHLSYIHMEHRGRCR